MYYDCREAENINWQSSELIGSRESKKRPLHVFGLPVSSNQQQLQERGCFLAKDKRMIRRSTIDDTDLFLRMKRQRRMRIGLGCGPHGAAPLYSL